MKAKLLNSQEDIFEVSTGSEADKYLLSRKRHQELHNRIIDEYTGMLGLDPTKKQVAVHEVSLECALVANGQYPFDQELKKPNKYGFRQFRRNSRTYKQLEQIQQRFLKEDTYDPFGVFQIFGEIYTGQSGVRGNLTGYQRLNDKCFVSVKKSEFIPEETIKDLKQISFDQYYLQYHESK